MTRSRERLDARAVELLRAARDWRLIGLLFERPRDGWRAEVAKLALGCDDVELARAAELARDANEPDYLDLLGPGGAASPREAGYRKTTDPARLLAEIRAYHAAFAFESCGEDPPDHIAVEAGFVGWLCLKEAFARANGSGEATSVTFAARRDFLGTHVASVVHGLARRLEAVGEGYLLSAARAAATRVGPPPTGLEGDWVPHGFDDRVCGSGCGLAGASDAAEGAPEPGDGFPPC